MRRGTTPTLVLEMPGEIPVKDLSELVLSIQQKNNEVIEKRLFDMSVDEMTNTLEVVLMQEETLLLQDSRIADVQVKVKLADDSVIASEVIRVPVSEILNEEVI